MVCWLALREKRSECFLRLVGPYSFGEHLVLEFHSLLQLLTEYAPFMNRMRATVTKVASSHVPMLSNPNVVIEVIRTAAKSVQARSTAA